LTRGGRLATLDRSEGIGMDEIDDRTVAGLKAVQHHEYGDVAITEGRFGRRSGDRLLDSGTYLSVVRRQPDGAWRWSIDMWNSDAG
jgi:ketosteroid isomerase-like protein